VLTPPVSVALARRVHQLPTLGDRWSFEPKYDGWRVVMFRTDDGVILQSRAGRIITQALPDLASAGLQLPVGVVLDGEAVVYRGGRLDFAAMQRRALSNAQRAAALAHQLPASYAVFDCLQDDTGEDLRPRPYDERRAALLRLLEDVGPPIQATPATRDRELAMQWYELLPEMGVEGLLIKHRDRGYAAARIWQKLKHSTARP